MVMNLRSNPDRLASQQFSISDERAVDLWLATVQQVKATTGLSEGPELTTLAAKQWLSAVKQLR